MKIWKKKHQTTKDDIYFELLQYCDINPDYDIDDEIRTNMRLYAINELYIFNVLHITRNF